MRFARSRQTRLMQWLRQRCSPDLMIVDARLGDESGIAAVDQILCTGPVPHMFISGDPVSVRLLRPDAVVVQKPFRVQDLAVAMQQVTGAAAAFRG
jgi:hypothetical protein